MKVWIIGRGIPSSKNKMLGSFELEQAQALEKKGVDVIYIAMSVRSGRNLQHIGYRFTVEKKVPIFSINFPIGRLFPQKITDGLFDIFLKYLSKIIIKKYGMPNIVHVHYPAQRSYRFLERIQKKGVKIVATEHWSKVQDKTLNIKSLQNIKEFAHKCDSFICVSSCLKQSVLELTGVKRKVFNVPNLVNPYFTNNSISNNSCEDFRYVVSGRLVDCKRVDKVIRAFISVFSKDEKVSLFIAGGGAEYSKLKQIIDEEEREKQIHLMGTVTRVRMAELLASSNVLVTYSELETFCVPIIEAWMCGKPVIATDSIPVMIENNDSRLGLTVEHNNVESLEKALLDMRDSWNEYDSKWIENYARNHFSESAVAQRLLDIYYE